MNDILAKNIKLFRDKLALTQEELAEYLAVNREEISYYENGRRNIPPQILIKMAKLFGVDEYDLLIENEEEMNLKLAFAFPATKLNVEDLNAIADFKKIGHNYLKLREMFRMISV